jgi:CRP-like cAMP-binding protein
VVRFGEDADFLGVLLKGKLSASVMADRGQRTTIGHLEEGATFGEMALMSGDKTMADLIAETNCQVLRIPVELFQSVIMTEPNAFNNCRRM